MDVESAAPLDNRDTYRRRSPSPIRRRYSRSRSRSRSRDRYYRGGDRSPDRRRRYSRSPRRDHYRRRSPPRPRRTREVIRGTDEERMRTCSIFVGNLPYIYEERDVVNMMERFGRLRQVSVPIDRYTRRNRGFAFVDFEQRADAEDAFAKFDGYELEGRKLRLDWDIGRNAKEGTRSDRSPRRDNRRSPYDRSPRGRSPPPRSPPRGDRSPVDVRNNRSASPTRYARNDD